MEKKINVYAYTKLRSPKLDLNKEESYLLSRLVNIENKIMSNEIKLEEIAFEIYKCFENSDTNIKIDRVCISFMTPFSNKLNVLSSHNNEKLGKNMMSTGYNCFIANDSSLFKISETDIRISNDYDNIIEKYKLNSRPVQKSLNNIYNLGIRSGMTMTSSVGNFGKGFLFLNSKSKNAYANFSDGDYLIICILKMLLNISLNRFFSSFMKLEVNYNLPTSNEKNIRGILNSTELTRFLNEKLSIKTEFTQNNSTNIDSTKYFFIQEYSLLYLANEVVSKHFSLKKLDSMKFDLSVIEDKLKLKVFPGVQSNKKPIESIQLLAPLLGFTVVIFDDYFEISQFFEVASEQEVLNGYSI